MAGVVIKAADDGSGPGRGSLVVGWPEQGGRAHMVAIPTTHLAVPASEVSLSAAATLPAAGVTALRVLRLAGDPKGKRVVTGVAGGVGRFAIELAAGVGASPTAVAAGPSRDEGLDELGADAGVDEIEAADGRFDLTLESVGGKSLEAAVRLIVPSGTIAVYGDSSDTTAQISFGDFRGRAGARIEAFFVYESDEPPTFGEGLQRLAGMVAEALVCGGCIP